MENNTSDKIPIHVTRDVSINIKADYIAIITAISVSTTVIISALSLCIQWKSLTLQEKSIQKLDEQNNALKIQNKIYNDQIKLTERQLNISKIQNEILNEQTRIQQKLAEKPKVLISLYRNEGNTEISVSDGTIKLDISQLKPIISSDYLEFDLPVKISNSSSVNSQNIDYTIRSKDCQIIQSGSLPRLDIPGIQEYSSKIDVLKPWYEFKPVNLRIRIKSNIHQADLQWVSGADNMDPLRGSISVQI